MYKIIKTPLRDIVPTDIAEIISAEPHVLVSGTMIADALPAWFDELVIMCPQAQIAYHFDIFELSSLAGVTFKESYIYQSVNSLQSLIRLGVKFEKAPRDPFIVADMLQLNFGLTSPISHIALDLTSRADVMELYTQIEEGQDPLLNSTLLSKYTYDAIVLVLMAKAQTKPFFFSQERANYQMSNLEDQMEANYFLAFHAAQGFTVKPERLKNYLKDLVAEAETLNESITGEIRKTCWPDGDPKPALSLF